LHIIEYNRSRILAGVAKTCTDIFSLHDEARHALSLFGMGSRFFIHYCQYFGRLTLAITGRNRVAISRMICLNISYDMFEHKLYP